jgi:cell division protein FtsI/penicillin-binding protein 2
LDYAHRFGFDYSLNTDFNLPASQIGLGLKTEWEVAEVASGYTKDVTLSPVHAAQLAAIVANDGRMVVPHMVERVLGVDGVSLYSGATKPSDQQVISEATAASLRSLMVETTRSGSARSSFGGLNKYKVYKNMEIGGKTGSLTGFSPKGRHDWFVGYVKKDGRRIAYASLIINKEKWYVRSAYVARQFIYNYFTNLDKKPVAVTQ